jgi:hypothetical protein
MVLVIPPVVSLLGDNPMQSELAYYVGLMGKYFYHVCKVKGFDAAEAQKDGGRVPSPAGSHAEGSGDDTAGYGSIAGSDAGGGTPKKSKKKSETLDEMFK